VFKITKIDKKHGNFGLKFLESTDIKEHQYTIYIEGMQFFIQSDTPLELPEDCEVFTRK
jgi:hypothetical protein